MSRAVITLAGDTVGLVGYMPGFRQPILRVNATVDSAGTKTGADQAARALKTAIPQATEMETGAAHGIEDRHAVIDLLMHWIVEIQCVAGFPMLDRAAILNAASDGVSGYLLAIPVFDGAHLAVNHALRWLAGLINGAYANEPLESHFEKLGKPMAEMKQCLPAATTTIQFLQAANALDIPTSHFGGDVFQFGQGARARLLAGSFTDATPRISTYLARNKLLTASVLRRAGLPVPTHALAATIDEALRIAEKFGYPVVVKPLDLDGGMGVFAGLRNGDELRKAYQAARKYTQNILVEKHFEGRDYRIAVFQGVVERVVERVPGGVTGDGVHTVRALMEEINRDPRRGPDPTAVLKSLVLDDEALDLLATENLTPESVPAAGRFVRFRRTSNISTGGSPVLIADKIHPDNLLLARRAASILRLDIAGIDLLIPDIARPWWETGAVICEVNAQPDLGRITAGTLYEDILRKLVTGNGRIPLAIVVGEPSGTTAASLAAYLSATNLNTGRADKDTVWIGSDCVARNVGSVFAGGRMLLSDRAVNAAILSIHAFDVLDTGLPFDRFDALIVAGDDVAPYTPAHADGLATDTLGIGGLVKRLLPACRGPVLMTGNAPWAPAIRNYVPADRIVEVGDANDLASSAGIILSKGL